MFNKNIEITVPVLDEEDSIVAQFETLIDFLDLEMADYENIKIIIADNGSTDRTQELSEALAANHDRIQYLRLEERGVGRALKSSWGASQADIVGYMDLDWATDLKHLPEAFEPLMTDEADVVTGSRLLPKSKVKNRKLIRAFTSRAFNTMVQTYLGAKFSDGMCGFKFLQRRHLDRLRELGANNDGWFFATELLMCAQHEKLRILDLPVVWTDDPNSKAKIGKLAKEYMRSMKELKESLANSKSA
ncbi:MAG: glycosyltransferase [Ponticaulis sp.]|nr:glycosyltransferase [Ponticaulis sp.]